VNAAQALVGTLTNHGVDRVFCVPGESFLAVLDALYDAPTINCIACRHESGAGLMAIADAKLTRRPGVVFVSRGPGATNVSLAIHVAQQDAVPLVVFVGQVARRDIGRAAFQEVDYRKALGGLCKAVWEVRDGSELAPVCARAFARAARGVPGPVLVSLPEDMQLDAAGTPAAPHASPRKKKPAADALARARDMIARAERPLVILGGAMDDAAREKALHFSEAFSIPVAVSWKQQHCFPNGHAHYAGHLGYGVLPTQSELLSAADLVIALGTRLGDVSSLNYRFPAAPNPAQPLIHVYPAAEAFTVVPRTGHALACDCGHFLAGLLEQPPGHVPASRAEWTSRLHAYVSEQGRWGGEPAPDGVAFGAVVDALNQLLPDDAIIVQDAGNHASWLHRYFRFRGRQTLLAALAGAMGFGVPGATAASLRHPERKVVCTVGDGSALMTGNELATAVQYGAKPVVIVSNNGSYGTIRQHQEKHFPGRVKATELRNPDFVRWGESFGVSSFRIERAEQAADVLQQALSLGRPALVEVRSSLRHLSAFAKLNA